MARNSSKTLIGPFKQVLTGRQFPTQGPIADEDLEVLSQGGILIQGDKILDVDRFESLAIEARLNKYTILEIEEDLVLCPGFIDCHTHLAWFNEKASALALPETTPPEELTKHLRQHILQTVISTRDATDYDLVNQIKQQLDTHLREGVTTCEIKSGYGLDVRDELSILEAINLSNWQHDMDIVPTCFAAHIPPPESADSDLYIDELLRRLFPKLLSTGFANRVDIWVDEMGFPIQEALQFLLKAKELDLAIHLHGGTFQFEACALATELNVQALAHLENIKEEHIKKLGQSGITTIILPQASQHLGQPMASARKLLDAGCSVAIATDRNPVYSLKDSLLQQANALRQDQGLSIAETLAGISLRAAKALGLSDRGTLTQHKMADMIAFSVADYQDIFKPDTHILPKLIFKRGRLLDLSKSS